MNVNNGGSADPETAGVRVCDSCGRPVAARSKAEYTAARARLLVNRGLCVCRQPLADAPSPAQPSSSTIAHHAAR